MSRLKQQPHLLANGIKAIRLQGFEDGEAKDVIQDRVEAFEGNYWGARSHNVCGRGPQR